MKRSFLGAATGCVLCVTPGCRRETPSPAPTPSTAPSASLGPAASATACGDIPCATFSAPGEAFARVLESSPRVLGVGESHAQKGTEAIEPATRRFARDFLPRLAGHASDLVIELMLPNPKCKKETKAAAKEQKVVTERQAPTDQNDYVALGTRAKELGIAPHALEPTCDDLAKIAAAGEGAVATSLDVVTRLATELATRLVDAQNHAPSPKMVVVYGGSLHNDAAPRPGREQWSFGPALGALTAGAYTELDLVVPEFIGDSPAWKALPWVPRFDVHAVRANTALLQPLPRSFVLVFPCSRAEGQPRGFIGGGGCE